MCKFLNEQKKEFQDVTNEHKRCDDVTETESIVQFDEDENKMRFYIEAICSVL